MKIDYMGRHPIGIVETYDIVYGEGRHLEGRVRGIVEEGFDEANWYQVEVVYPARHPERLHAIEIGGNLNNYKELKRAVPTLKKARAKLMKWCEGVSFQSFRQTKLFPNLL